MPIKKISEPIYQTDVHFIFDTPKQKALAYIRKYFEPLELEEKWDKAGMMYGDCGDYFIVIPDKKPRWTITTIIAHEAFHVVAQVMRSKGIILSKESEEAFNYLHTWILQTLTDFYKQHQKRQKPMKSKSVSSKTKRVFKKKK